MCERERERERDRERDREEKESKEREEKHIKEFTLSLCGVSASMSAEIAAQKPEKIRTSEGERRGGGWLGRGELLDLTSVNRTGSLQDWGVGGWGRKLGGAGRCYIRIH